MTTICAVGDIMLGDHPVRIGHGVRSTIARAGAASLFDGVRSLWSGADLLFGNLEVVHADAGLVAGRLETEEFRGAPPTIATLREEGFRVLGVANNHALHHGAEAFEECVARLRGAGIVPLGLADGRGGTVLHRETFAGGGLVMLGYSLRPEEHRPGVPPPYALGAEARMIEDIRAAASGGDAVLVSLHWGDEYVEYPSLAQMRFARRLVEAGADIIVGHHPHVVQGVERYRGAVIAYSLGNFVFDMWQRATRHSILLTVVLRGKGDLDHRVAPVWIGADHRPVASADLHPYRKAEVLFRRQADRLSLPAREQDRLDAEYRALARRRMRRNRYEDYAFFISRLLTYRPTYVCQSVSRSLGRRREQVAQALRGKGLPG